MYRARCILLIPVLVGPFLSVMHAGVDGTETAAGHEDVVKMYQETGKKISQWEGNQECSASKSGECSAEASSDHPHPTIRIERIKHLPDEEMAGVDHDMLHLCATISGGVYDAASRSDFERVLEGSKIRERFPDLTLRFFQNGVTFGRDLFPEQISLDAPTFVAVITGSTLVLGWRGTVTIKDMFADANIDSVSPWQQKLKGLEVQKAYYEMIKDVYFRSHAKDIENYVKGAYSKVPNKAKKDGTPITRIILTGHR